IKLAFAETGVTLPEQNTAPGSHGTLATAESLGELPSLNVPNTLPAGTQNFGKQFDVSALAVTGEIKLNGTHSEDDYYSFAGKAGDLMHFEVMSASLVPPRGNTIDSILRVYDSTGKLLAVNDDEFETTDSNIVDFVLPGDGVYYVQVDTFA